MELARLGPSPCDALEVVSAHGAAVTADEEKESEGDDGDGPTAAEVEKLDQLLAMFPDVDASVALVALRAKDGVVEGAIDWIFSNMG